MGVLTIPAGGSGTVTVTAAWTDPVSKQTFNETKEVTFGPLPLPSPQAMVTYNPTTATPGGTQVITLTITNTGPGSTTGPFTLTANISPQATPGTNIIATDWTCTVASNPTSGSTITCTTNDPMPGNGNLPPIPVPVIILPTTPGTTEILTISGNFTYLSAASSSPMTGTFTSTETIW
jgi:hypothetical protein